MFRPPVPTSQASSSTSTLLPSTSISLPISSSTSVVSAVSSPPLLIQTIMPLSPSSSSVPSSVLSSDFSPQKQSISQRPVPCSPAAVSIANSDKQGKKTKYDEVTQCLICEKTAKRFDRHLQSCHPELTSEDCQILKDFVRTRGRHTNTKIFECKKHNRRFPNKADHKRHYNCDLADVDVVKNHQSKT